MSHILYTDIDGVLLQFIPTLLDVLKERREIPCDVLEDDVSTFYIEEALGLPPSVVASAMGEVWTRPLPPYPGVQDMLGELNAMVEVVGLTDRPSTQSLEAAKRDLADLCLLQWHSVDSDKKVDVVRHRLMLDGFVFVLEDKLRTITRMLDLPGQDRLFLYLMDRPWNNSMDLRGIRRVYTHAAVVDDVRWQLGRVR